jgi:hypothetical protein
MIKKFYIYKNFKHFKYYKSQYSIFLKNNIRSFNRGNIRYYYNSKKEPIETESKLASSLLRPLSFKNKIINFGTSTFNFLIFKLPQLLYKYLIVFTATKALGSFIH